VPQFPNAAAPRADLPLAGLAVNEQPVSGELLAAPYCELAEPTDDASVEIVHGASHESLISNRDHAQAVVKAIQAVVQGATHRFPKS
jgi:hypothetical protein